MDTLPNIANILHSPDWPEITDIPCGLVVTSPTGQILRANRTLLKWTQYSEDELTKLGSFCNLLTDEGRTFYNVSFKTLLKMRGYADEIALDLESKFQLRIPALISAAQDGGRDGLIKFIVFRAHARQAYETSLTEARRKAEDLAVQLATANANLDRFAAIASHDLQEPLNSMLMYSQLLQDEVGAQLPGAANDLINQMQKTGDRMRRLIKNLLIFARSGADHPRFSRISCDAVLTDALADLRMLIEEAKAEVVYTALPHVQGHASLLTQLFQNLITNAIKYRRDDVTPRVEIKATISGSDYEFSVRDNGTGFDPQKAKEIFQPFVRLSSRTGTGLGLATCERIVRSHGGKIWATSTPGAGSIFTFTLPQITVAG